VINIIKIPAGVYPEADRFLKFLLKIIRNLYDGYGGWLPLQM